MSRYLIKRLLIMIPTLLCIVLVTMILMSLLVGTNKNEFSSYGGGDRLDKAFEALNAEDSFIAKYIRYLVDLAHSGKFYQQDFKNEYLLMRAKYTALITALGVILSIIVGVPAGIFSAMHQNKAGDNAAGVATLVLSSIPSYVLAICFSLCFAVWLKWLPLFGFSTPKHFIMPVLVISAGGIALMTRMTRAAALEVLNKPYITVLRAKGISERRVVYVHVFKNSLVTVLPTLNNLAAQILCSTIVVENIYSMPGLGSTIVSAVGIRDQRDILAAVIILSLILMAMTVMFDILSAYVNPQIRDLYKRGTKSN